MTGHATIRRLLFVARQLHPELVQMAQAVQDRLRILEQWDVATRHQFRHQRDGALYRSDLARRVCSLRGMVRNARKQ